VTVASTDEERRESTGDGFEDTLTFAFGDRAGGRFGLARLAVTGGERAGGAGVLFHGGEAVALRAEGDREAPAGGWETLEAAGADTLLVVEELLVAFLVLTGNAQS